MAAAPIRFVCPQCGHDSSEAVSQMIRDSPPAAVPPPPPPSPRPAQDACLRHPGQTAVTRCAVCGKPLCPLCVELFGAVCSALCRGKAESQGLELPSIAGQSRAAQDRRLKHMGWGVGAAALAGLALVGLYIWYTWVASIPSVRWSAAFPQAAESAQCRPAPSGQLIVLHAGVLARYDTAARTQVWRRSVLDPALFASQVDAMLQAQAAARESALAAGQSPIDWPAPTAQSVQMELFQAAQERLRLIVRDQAVWVVFPDKLVRYDWAAGQPLQELSRAETGAPVSLSDAEFLFLAKSTGPQGLLTRVNAATGETVSGPVPFGPSALAGGPSRARPGSDGALDPAALANRARSLSLQRRATLPVAAASAAHQERLLEEMRDPSDTPAAPALAAKPAPAAASPGETVRVLASGNSLIECSIRLLERRIVARQAMKAPKPSALDQGRITHSMEIASDILNDMQRDRGADTVQEDQSTYRVTLRRPGAPDWTTDMTSPPEVFPLQSVDLVVAGRQLVALDKSNAKLWEATLPHGVNPVFDPASPGGDPATVLGPCLERDGAVLVCDQGGLTAFHPATGAVQWRLATVGISGLCFDGPGVLYVNSTTATEENLKFSRQIDLTRQTRPLVLKIDPKTGRVLWKTVGTGPVVYASGKFLYTLDAFAGDPESRGSLFNPGPARDARTRVCRLDPGTGRVRWEHEQPRLLLDAQFDRNTFQLVFRKEMQTLGYTSL